MLVLMGFQLTSSALGSPSCAGGGPMGVNWTHTWSRRVLLDCDTVKPRNIPKLDQFHSWCKGRSVAEPVSCDSHLEAFTHGSVPSIPPPNPLEPQPEV